MMYPVDRVIDNMRETDDRFRNLWEQSTQEQRLGLIDAVMDALLEDDDDDDDDPDDGSECPLVVAGTERLIASS